jgi:hypothetical protein
VTKSIDQSSNASKALVRVGAALGATMGGLLLLVGIFYLVAVRPAAARLPPPPDTPASSPADAMRQDLAYVRRLPEVDRSFSPAERVSFEAEIDALSAKVDQLDPASFEMGVTRAVALAGNGHTYVRGVAMGRSLNSIPVRMVWFADGLYVVSAKSSFAQLVGGQVLRIGDQTPEHLVDVLRPYVGGRETRARLFSPTFMGSPAALHALGLGDASLIRITVRKSDGQEVAVDVPADPRPMMRGEDDVRWPALDLLPGAVPKDDGAWVHVLDGRGEVPLALRRPDRWNWFDWPSQDLLFMELRRTRNRPGEPLKPILAQAEDEAKAHRPKNAIVDLRADTGGSYELAADFAKRLPDLVQPDGRVFILVGPDTFSAGIVAVAQLKHAAGSRGVIVGEPMGDHPQFWAEGGRIILPHSKLVVRFASAFHDWENGCGLKDLGRCYWMNYFGGVAAGPLEPELQAPLRFADYIQGRDPAMEAVMQSIKGASRD